MSADGRSVGAPAWVEAVVDEVLEVVVGCEIDELVGGREDELLGCCGRAMEVVTGTVVGSVKD